MTREEEIRQAALKYSFDTDGGYTGDLNTGRDDFTEGAEWADEHPASAWHSVADGDFPKESKGDLFNVSLLVCMPNGRMFPAYYDMKESTFADEFNEVIEIAYWMEIPQIKLN